MPFVSIRLIENRSQQQKDEIAKRVNDAISDVLHLPSSGATSSRGCSSRAAGPSSACRAGAPMPRRATATSRSISSTLRMRRKSLPD